MTPAIHIEGLVEPFGNVTALNGVRPVNRPTMTRIHVATRIGLAQDAGPAARGAP